MVNEYLMNIIFASYFTILKKLNFANDPACTFAGMNAASGIVSEACSDVRLWIYYLRDAHSKIPPNRTINHLLPSKQGWYSKRRNCIYSCYVNPHTNSVRCKNLPPSCTKDRYFYLYSYISYNMFSIRWDFSSFN